MKTVHNFDLVVFDVVLNDFKGNRIGGSRYTAAGTAVSSVS